MAFCEEMQIELPDSFPMTSFTEFMATGRKILLPDPLWSEFGPASNLIAWRYRACAEDCNAYLSLWKNVGAMPNSHEEVYLRERALFGMFVSGVSCIESTCYTICALASSPKVLEPPFGPGQQRRASPFQLRRALIPHAASMKTERLIKALTAIHESDDWKTWIDFRNRMAHRSNIPHRYRVIVTAESEAPPAISAQFAQTSSSSQMEAGDEAVARLFSWLSPTLEALLEGGRALALG
jgi:hypothetical protein